MGVQLEAATAEAAELREAVAGKSADLQAKADQLRDLTAQLQATQKKV